MADRKIIIKVYKTLHTYLE